MDSKNIVIKSAVPLSEDEVSSIEKVIVKKLGSPVSSRQEVDKSLLGGFIVMCGDWVLDASLVKKLQIVKNSLKS